MPVKRRLPGGLPDVEDNADLAVEQQGILPGLKETAQSVVVRSRRHLHSAHRRLGRLVGGGIVDDLVSNQLEGLRPDGLITSGKEVVETHVSLVGGKPAVQEAQKARGIDVTSGFPTEWIQRRHQPSRAGRGTAVHDHVILVRCGLVAQSCLRQFAHTVDGGGERQLNVGAEGKPERLPVSAVGTAHVDASLSRLQRDPDCWLRDEALIPVGVDEVTRVHYGKRTIVERELTAAVYRRSRRNERGTGKKDPIRLLHCAQVLSLLFDVLPHTPVDCRWVVVHWCFAIVAHLLERGAAGLA